MFDSMFMPYINGVVTLLGASAKRERMQVIKQPHLEKLFRRKHSRIEGFVDLDEE
ncbi:predicted protein [Histoplasma mississippiense (nom. inval.)]|uniref:predicted protein n=1 Tax=Ajellomyces capsulatus (strain NAm1 / WU24) TaxID=2059318 RepID=UPI000157C0E6|nr:predicted protein [Histoplasma mississippiense (nom. inval.)]EDN06440.1 predicted protein [Histoplasma mississippiense (nom. inval.)]